LPLALLIAVYPDTANCLHLECLPDVSEASVCDILSKLLILRIHRLQVKSPPCVLAIDDEPAILDLISISLQAEGYRVVTAETVAEFWLRHDEFYPDIYVIDLTLPDGSGLNLIKEVRRKSDCGIIVISGRDSEADQVVSLEIGADDYMTKPFRLRELAARANAVYRRSPATARALSTLGEGRQMLAKSPTIDFVFDDYKISVAFRQIWGPGMVEINLTTAEFDLLLALIERRGQVLNRDQIMNAIKGRDWESYDRVIDGLVSRLRKKIPVHDRSNHYIRTIHGVGYSFSA
jgi:two-component system, OmpR family, response regulator